MFKEDKFLRGYFTAILMILLFAAAFHLGNVLGEEMESSETHKVLSLRKLHEKDQKEAGRDQ